MINGWVTAYQDKNPKKTKPFHILSQGRRDSYFSIFNQEGSTKSLQLFKNLVSPAEQAALQDLINNQYVAKPSCSDSFKHNLTACYNRMRGN